MALKGPEALIALDRCRGRTTGWVSVLSLTVEFRYSLVPMT